jgi:flavin reductase (DIM6/NTAB) family NADH-FMN oxidoreductase RutF
MNMFPTDLHGSIGNKGYTGSLRIHGKANGQVEAYKRIVISTVEVRSFQQCYSLGKNHMMDLRDFDAFSIYPERSHVFNFPLPNGVVSYRELELVDSLDFGIHRIHFYEVINEYIVRQKTETLGHIHQYYAQWRNDHALNTSLYFRSMI